eukprot:gnl/TRDRNA2_/TRDRNA2_143306_c0_seq1.p1 gnl/TRDRNA2_/TRDRNA2_143306_c0~~gnl/TRDRNA2_/TRDRNA2_143306_c0_seq1.p1  ORF type:complete len:113 (+),score=16.84 gnl/TRDRNA2_/TRDRNA2_143306_c0_seq1:24-341(+)
MACEYPDKLYLVGKTGQLLVCECFNVATCSWDALQIKPIDIRSPRAMRVSAGRLCILGGDWNQKEDHFETEGVLIETSTCRTRKWEPPMPTARLEFAMTAVRRCR